MPPAWVKRLIFIEDGDSHRVSTRAKLEAGLRRAMALRPGLVAQIVRAGNGVDLNDVLRGKTGCGQTDCKEIGRKETGRKETGRKKTGRKKTG